MSETNGASESLPTIPLTQLMPTLPPQYDYEAGLAAALDGMNYTGIAKAMRCDRRTLVRLRHQYIPLSESLARARALSLEYRADELSTLCQDHPELHDNPQVLKTMFETGRWYLACSDPRKYGERMNIEITEHVDLKASLAQAKERVLKQVPQADTQAEPVNRVNPE